MSELMPSTGGMRCLACGGNGVVPTEDPMILKLCPTCDGSGFVSMHPPSGEIVVIDPNMSAWDGLGDPYL